MTSGPRTRAPRDPASALTGAHIVVAVGGGIAAYKAAELVRLLDKAGATVHVAMTARAQKFIAPMTFQALTRRPVFTDLFSLTEEAAIGHIQLADRADLVIVAPATANVIGRLAGACLGFWLNGKWTFAGDDTHVGRHAAARFIAMWVALTVLNTWIVAVIDDQFGLRLAQLLKPGADLVSGGIGFLLSRHWVYKKAG